MAAHPWTLSHREVGSPSLSCGFCPPSPGCSHSGSVLSGDPSQLPFCRRAWPRGRSLCRCPRWVNQPSTARLSHPHPDGWVETSLGDSHPQLFKPPRHCGAETSHSQWVLSKFLTRRIWEHKRALPFYTTKFGGRELARTCGFPALHRPFP